MLPWLRRVLCFITDACFDEDQFYRKEKEYCEQTNVGSKDCESELLKRTLGQCDDS